MRFNDILQEAYNRRATIKQVQQVVRVPIDGGYGPQTETAINAMQPDLFLSGFVITIVTSIFKLA